MLSSALKIRNATIIAATQILSFGTYQGYQVQSTIMICREKYCKNVPLDKYDTYLIFPKDRFEAGDLKLAKRIRSTGKKFFYIRARIDQDVENEKRICEKDKNANVTSEEDENAKKISEKDKNAKRSRKRLFDRDALLDRIRENLSKNLIGRGLLTDKKEIFLISNHFLNDYQFGELTEAIFSHIAATTTRESHSDF